MQRVQNGRTVLHAACRLGLTDIAQLLLQHGADPHGAVYLEMLECKKMWNTIASHHCAVYLKMLKSEKIRKISRKKGVKTPPLPRLHTRKPAKKKLKGKKYCS